MTKEQALQLLEAAQGDRFEALLTLAVATGMRRGELLALRWADINFQEGSLWVRHTINRVGKHGLVENDPKTESSKRNIPLPRFVLTALLQHRAWQAEVRAKAGKPGRSEILSSAIIEAGLSNLLIWGKGLSNC